MSGEKAPRYRTRNIDWNVNLTKGSMRGGEWGVSQEAAHLCVLMDIRDELQKLNRVFDCPSTREIPKILKTIRANTSRIPVKKK